MQLTTEIAKELAVEVAFLAVATAEVALLYRHSILLAAVLLATVGGAVAFWPRRGALCVVLIGAVVGPSAEIICASRGAWQYAHPDFLGIPLWLPIAWGLAALLVQGISETLAKLGAGGVTRDA